MQIQRHRDIDNRWTTDWLGSAPRNVRDVGDMGCSRRIIVAPSTGEPSTDAIAVVSLVAHAPDDGGGRINRCVVRPIGYETDSGRRADDGSGPATAICH